MGLYRSKRVFVSSNQAVATTTSQTFSVAHGLGKVPSMYRVVAVCTSAINGWSVGDETDIMINMVDNGALQVLPWADATNIYWGSGSSMMICNRTNQFSYNIINAGANWSVKVYAFE